MFKRTIWFSTGAVVGLGSSVWVQRRVRQAAQRYLPERVTRDAADSVRRLGRDVRAAAIEGRAAMREREAELQAEVRARRLLEPARRDWDRPPDSVPPALGAPGTTHVTRAHRVS